MPFECHFECHYDLDQRPDRKLVNLYQDSYRFIKTALGDVHNIPLDSDGLPDGIHYFLLYAAALIHGAADGSLTLKLHNLGREARILGRQIFEYWVRAGFYADNPTEAKALILSTPFTERAILDELGYDQNSERYQNLVKDCNEVLKRHPGFVVHQEPSLRHLVGARHDPTATKLYAFFYRIPGQTSHATGAGLGTVIREEGVAFDGREVNPNIGLYMETWVVQQFVALMEDRLKLNIDSKLAELKKRLETIRDRLDEDFGATAQVWS